MDKREFLQSLGEKLSEGLPRGEVHRQMRYYEGYIDAETSHGRREEEVIAELGDPWLLARNVMESPASSYGRASLDNPYQQGFVEGSYESRFSRQRAGSVGAEAEATGAAGSKVAGAARSKAAGAAGAEEVGAVGSKAAGEARSKAAGAAGAEEVGAVGSEAAGAARSKAAGAARSKATGAGESKAAGAAGPDGIWRRVPDPEHPVKNGEWKRMPDPDDGDERMMPEKRQGMSFLLPLLFCAVIVVAFVIAISTGAISPGALLLPAILLMAALVVVVAVVLIRRKR